MNQASQKGSLRFRGHSRHKKYKNKLNELNASLVAVNTMDAESLGVVQEEPSVQLQHPVPWQWSVPLMASPIINYTSMTTRPSDIEVGNIFRFPQPMDPPHQRKKGVNAAQIKKIEHLGNVSDVSSLKENFHQIVVEGHQTTRLRVVSISTLKEIQRHLKGDLSSSVLQ